MDQYLTQYPAGHNPRSPRYGHRVASMPIIPCHDCGTPIQVTDAANVHALCDDCRAILRREQEARNAQ